MIEYLRPRRIDYNGQEKSMCVCVVVFDKHGLGLPDNTVSCFSPSLPCGRFYGLLTGVHQSSQTPVTSTGNRLVFLCCDGPEFLNRRNSPLSLQPYRVETEGLRGRSENRQHLLTEGVRMYVSHKSGMPLRLCSAETIREPRTHAVTMKDSHD